MERQNDKCASETTAAKPKIVIVPLDGGMIRIVGSKAAADYCGVSHQAFGRVVRRINAQRIRPRTIYKRAEDLVKAKYPELFDGVSI